MRGDYDPADYADDWMDDEEDSGAALERKLPCADVLTRPGRGRLDRSSLGSGW
jgi:hypothetical protein